MTPHICLAFFTVEISLAGVSGIKLICNKPAVRNRLKSNSLLISFNRLSNSSSCSSAEAAGKRFKMLNPDILVRRDSASRGNLTACTEVYKITFWL